ncbi:hypothetical protein A1351_22685 [Methylosinus sp. R-45379]|uniref:HNH endonuclease signature motif containing protein n=1 Tax=Methylosinus sp. R-45379 TaxID=980563 RepID=UPI0007C8EF84|nr:HNH endonuclease [Methylosinus sp. R-45379]OAI30574.1 hypothetical protein A1351_22685 [Methylosinus sp. R-45379]
MKLKTLAPKVRPMRAKIEVKKRTDDFYRSPGWNAFKKQIRAERGRVCERCGKTYEGDGSPVDLILDHIIERRDGGADLDPHNVQQLCVATGGNGRPHADGKRGGCHNRKTAEAKQIRAHGR